MAATARKISTRKRPRKYKKQDIAASAVLRAISPKAFNLIRRKGWMQLPSRTTVVQWLKIFTVADGIQHNLMDIVKAKYPEPESKEVFLSFDEMSLKERWTYDKVAF